MRTVKANKDDLDKKSAEKVGRLPCVGVKGNALFIQERKDMEVSVISILERRDKELLS